MYRLRAALIVSARWARQDKAQGREPRPMKVSWMSPRSQSGDSDGRDLRGLFVVHNCHAILERTESVISTMKLKLVSGTTRTFSGEATG
jgi:hypothetical protein